MKIKKIITIISLLILFTTLFGCGEMDRTQKTLCYSLTTKSYAYVPPCETEKTCYEKVDELFHTNFDSETESQLFYLKNKWARSWFFYNKALNEIKKAPNLCLKGDAGQITSIINQTNKYLDHSFSELDDAMKRSFDIISTQEKRLTEEKIDLIKEEALFDSLIELRQITTEVSSPTSNSGTYLSFYLTKVKEFNDLGIKKGYQELIETDSIQVKSFGIIGNFIYELDKTRNELLPFLGLSYENIQETMENLIFSSQNLKSLSKFPISEFTRLYSSVAGNKNSALEKFSGLMNNISDNKKTTIKTKEILITEIEIKRTKSNKLMEAETKSNEFLEIEKYFFGTKLSSETTNKELFEEIELEYYNLREKRKTNKIKLGEELLLLKSLDIKLNQLINNLEIPSKERTEKVIAKCLEKATTEKEDNSPSNKTEDKELTSQREDLIYYANKTVTSKEDEIFYYCNKLITSSENLIIIENNYKNFILSLTNETKDCFNYLEKNIPLLNEEELTNQFKILKEENFENKSISYFNKTCQNIKKQIGKFIESSFNENGISEELETRNKLQATYLKTKLFMREETSNNINTALNQYNSYFYEENLIDAYLLGKDLALKLKEKNEYISQQIKKEAVNYAEKNYYIVSEDLNNIKTNQEIKIKSKIYLNNPFDYLDEKISINLKKDFEIINSHSKCYFNSNEIEQKINFSCLEEGTNYVELYLTDNIISEEKDEVIYASNKKSLIKREIILKSEINYPFVKITTKPLSNNYTAYWANEEVFGKINEKEIEFTIPLNNQNKKVEIFFYTTNLIKTEKELLSNTQKEITKEMNYKIKLKNTSTLKFESIIIFPIIINGYVENIKISNEFSEIKNFEIIDQELVLKKQSFLELEEKDYFLKLQITQLDEYYLEILSNLVKDLEKIENVAQIEEIKKIIKNPENYSADQLEKIIITSEKIIANFEKTQTEEEKLELLKNKLENIIEEKLKTAELLLKYGLEKEALELRGKIEEYYLLKETTSQSKIIDAINNLEKISHTAIQKMILKTKEINENISKATTAEQEDLSNIIKENISSLPETFLQDPKKAEDILFKIKENEIKFYELKTNSNLFENESPSITKTDLLVNECYYLLNLLEKELEVDEKELIAAKFIPPITVSRLKKIKLELNDINFSTTKNDPQKLIDFKAELKTAFDSLKKQTINLYNNSVDKPVEMELLKKSKELIDSNKYVAAFLLLSNSKNTNQINLINFIPILIIIVIALFVKSKLGKDENEKNSKKNIILSEWEN